MYCRICGIQINDTDLYCPKCGTRAVNTAAQFTFFRNPGVSAVLSTLVPGLGQVYNGQLRKGIPLLVLSVLSLAFSPAIRIPERFAVYLLYLVLWVLGIVDAYKSAVKINVKLK